MSERRKILAVRHGVQQWSAHLETRPETAVGGRTHAEAIGRLVIAIAEKWPLELGVEIEIKW